VDVLCVEVVSDVDRFSEDILIVGVMGEPEAGVIYIKVLRSVIGKAMRYFLSLMCRLDLCQSRVSARGSVQ